MRKGYGKGVAPGFSQTGGVDMVVDLIRGWGRRESRDGRYDPCMSIPQEIDQGAGVDPGGVGVAS